MSSIYAVVEGTGKRILVEIECDGSGCVNKIKPNPKISQSGWTKTGLYAGSCSPHNMSWDWCLNCTGRLRYVNE